MEEKLLAKCMKWLGDEVSKDNISVVSKEEDSGWYTILYLAAWNDDDGYTHVYLIRVWNVDEEGARIYLSQDYENCVKIEDFVSIIPKLMAEINRVR